jgi:hypothetical protein
MWELPSELEETALRWRQSRLEQHGFPDWDEALSVYALPSGSTCHPDPPEPADRDGLATPRVLLPALAGYGPLAEAIDAVAGESRDRVLHGLISVANRLLVADALDTGDPSAHRRALGKAAGYLRIALDKRGAERPGEAAEALEQVPVIELFRVGYAEAVGLQRRARELFATGWASGRSEAIELLDSPVRERIASILGARPLYFEWSEETGSGRLREFRHPAEIAETRVAVEMAEIVGGLLVEGLGLDIDAMLRERRLGTEEPHRFSTILLTLLAWHATRGELRGEPLPASVSAEFLRNVASARTADRDAPARALEALIETLAGRFGLDPRAASVLRAFGRFCLGQLAEECGSLDPGIRIESRFVGCLLLDE